MSFLPPSPPDPEGAKIDLSLERHEKAIEQQSMLNQNDEGVSEIPRRRGITDRLRSIFLRAYSSARVKEADVSDENLWERERQQRREHE